MKNEQEEDLNLERMEKSLIIKALNKFNQKKEAAKALGIAERTLRNKRKQYNIVKYEDGYRYRETGRGFNKSMV